MDHFPEKHKALVVDDSAFQRHMLSIVCTEAGYLTVLVNDGVEALKALDEMSFSLIVTDLEMPEMDGLQLIRELAEREIKSKVILVSGHSESLLDAAKQLAEQFGLTIAGTITKPYVPENFLELLLDASLVNPEENLHPQYQGEFQGRLSHKLVARGLEHDALIPYYQPKICQETSALIGFECLARWKTDNGKILSPASFIPTAEEYGLMTKFTDAIVQSAFEDLSYWHRRGYELPVSINISTDNFKDIEFPERIMNFVEHYQVPANAVILEITESKVMEEARECLEVMSRLRLRGIGISIDDFGTGYASLKQLQYFPFTELKLDRSYVAAAIDHKPSRTVLETGIQLARNLSLECVAEGVETEEQAELLVSLGCPKHQGYLYSKPIPSEDVIPWTSARFYDTQGGYLAQEGVNLTQPAATPIKKAARRYH